MTELDDYKRRVRAEARRVASEQGWCDDGLRETLRNLDIEPTERFTVPVELTFTRRVDIEVAAESMTEAKSRVARFDGQRIVRERVPPLTGLVTFKSFEVAESAAADAGDTEPEIGTNRSELEPGWYAHYVDRCANVGPRYYCSRPRGHEGRHMAIVDGEVREFWGAPAPEPRAPRPGDPTPPEGEWFTHIVRDWCGQRSMRGYSCSRPRGHASGQHVASSDRSVLETW